MTRTFEKRWEALPVFFMKKKDSEILFFSEATCSFGPAVPQAKIIATEADKSLAHCDECNGLKFKDTTSSEIDSGAITRRVWPVKVQSRYPHDAFGLTGTYDFEYPVFEEWDYRFDSPILKNVVFFMTCILFHCH